MKWSLLLIDYLKHFFFFCTIAMELFIDIKFSCFVHYCDDQWFAAHTTYIKTTSDCINSTKTIRWWFKPVGLWREDQRVREEIVIITIILILMRNPPLIITLAFKVQKLSLSFPRTQLGIYKPGLRHRRSRWRPVRPLLETLLTILQAAVDLTLNFLCRKNSC